MISLLVDQQEKTESSSGFTLLELMATLLVLGILLTMAISFGRSMWVENRSTTTVNGLLRALNYSRSEAILRNEKIIICPSSDQTSCDTTEWSRGQIVLTTSGTLLRVLSGLAAEDRLIWNSSLNKNQAIEWLPTGYTNGQRGSFYYCPGNAASTSARKLVLLNTGRMYTAVMTAAEYTKFCSPMTF